ncbi:hypothetical protein ANCDUO_23647 [Ancylostoma duodenale]|uniref:Kinesin motor domain-containing protein n=1 Tax=Ancylostoma duodenale TaxID=51022 RepID=A0A0C2C943_9BILA|nr:hypothetical protein ANCDUO_23647 [Ancylostoma duodenale]
MQILQEGNLRRTQESTEANKTSSRSHALLQVVLLRNNRPHSKLFLIDLAGSERASNTNVFCTLYELGWDPLTDTSAKTG